MIMCLWKEMLASLLQEGTTKPAQYRRPPNCSRRVNVTAAISPAGVAARGDNEVAGLQPVEEECPRFTSIVLSAVGGQHIRVLQEFTPWSPVQIDSQPVSGMELLDVDEIQMKAKLPP